MNFNQITNIVMNEAKKIANTPYINIDDNLLENGFDSINMIEFIVSVEEKLGIEFNNSTLNYNSIKSIKSISELAMKLLEGKATNVSWWSNIPVSINSAFGDALTPIQIDDTCMKLETLKKHNAPYGFCTKAVPTNAIYDKLKQIPITNKLTVRYSLTGLNEGGFSFEERLDAIKILKDIFGTIIIITRPLIFGRNTSHENLKRLVKTAKETNGLLITGGLHDQTKRKYVDDDVKKELIKLCKEYDVKYFHKSSCVSAYITGQKCWVHDLGNPKNIFVLDKLGYEYSIENDKIVLDYGTVGDLNFLRMVTNSNVYCKNLTSGYNLLSFSDSNCKFDVTSSWYSWSQNRPCQLNCDYCIIRDIEYLNEDCIIGVNPCEIENYAKLSKRDYQNPHWQKGKYKILNSSEYINYNNVRTVQDCMTNKY